jgi:hypothetical protein
MFLAPSVRCLPLGSPGEMAAILGSCIRPLAHTEVEGEPRLVTIRSKPVRPMRISRVTFRGRA